MNIVIYVLLFIVTTSGCAVVKEGVRGFSGISTRVLEDSRSKAINKTFDCDYLTCYTKTKEALKGAGAYIYTLNQPKNMIAVYISQEDTTPVGVFFTSIDVAHTKVEISSPSTYAKEFIASKITAAFENKETSAKIENKSE